MFESRISKELHRRVFELTLALYRVTDFFPQGEVLRKQLREKANEIFGVISEYGYEDKKEQDAVSILAKIQALRGYLGIARSMRFVRAINITVLEREYDNLHAFFEKEYKEFSRTQMSDRDTDVRKKEREEVKELPTWEEFTTDEALNERQKAIVEHIKQNQRAKISDFYSFFSGLSSKTIQRDLQDLVSKNMLKREGEKRWTVYSIGHGKTS